MMPLLAGTTLVLFLLGFLLRTFRQPYVIVYLAAGILLGPHLLGLIQDQELLGRIGVLGVDLLLFFVGMDVSPRRLWSHWKLAVFGTLLQIGVSVVCIWFLGLWFEWPLDRIILLGFVISLSSTAVVLKMLQDWGEFDSQLGQAVLAILLAQDFALIPMLVVVGLLRGRGSEPIGLFLQGVAGAGLVLLVAWLSRKGEIRLPFAARFRRDHELQVFGALTVCLGMSFLTGILGLSTALGAFVGGMIVGMARETEWVHRSLNPFRVVFVALFFVNVGMLIDLDFLKGKWLPILLLLSAAFLINTLINSGILRLFGVTWAESLYGGALLAQIGEFSFVLAAVGFQAGIIADFAYQATILIIALSLLFSPAWIALTRALQRRSY
jgi:CPA2 family monovalent cation:H+ antiporter-2